MRPVTRFSDWTQRRGDTMKNLLKVSALMHAERNMMAAIVIAASALLSTSALALYASSGLTDGSTGVGGGILFSTDLRQLRVSDRQEY